MIAEFFSENPLKFLNSYFFVDSPKQQRKSEKANMRDQLEMWWIVSAKLKNRLLHKLPRQILIQFVTKMQYLKISDLMGAFSLLCRFFLLLICYIGYMKCISIIFCHQNGIIRFICLPNDQNSLKHISSSAGIFICKFQFPDIQSL